MKKLCLFIWAIGAPILCNAEDKIELKTTTIVGNTELPKILYVVPWQDVEENKVDQQKLTLHSLFGDLFDPLAPEAPKHTVEK